LPASPTLRRSTPAGVIDEDLSHGSGCNPKEVCAVLPLDTRVIDKMEIGFVHQGGGL